MSDPEGLNEVLCDVVCSENGTIDFPLRSPLPAPGMKADPARLAPVLAEVDSLLESMEVHAANTPSLCFRPPTDGSADFELYMVRQTVPGTVALRTTGAWKRKGGWKRRGKK